MNSLVSFTASCTLLGPRQALTLSTTSKAPLPDLTQLFVGDLLADRLVLITLRVEGRQQPRSAKMSVLRLRAHDVEPDPLTPGFQTCRAFVPLWNHGESSRAADHLLRYHLEILAAHLDLVSGNE